MSCHEDGFPKLTLSLSLSSPPSISLAIRLYRPSLLEGILDDILCPYRTVEDKFLLVVQHLLFRMKWSIGVRHLVSSVLHLLIQQCPEQVFDMKFQGSNEQLQLCGMLNPEFVHPSS